MKEPMRRAVELRLTIQLKNTNITAAEILKLLRPVIDRELPKVFALLRDEEIANTVNVSAVASLIAEANEPVTMTDDLLAALQYIQEEL